MAHSLAEVLAKARTEAVMSLRDVERVTGIHNAHLSQIEKGVIATPAVGILWQLANVYKLDFAKLMQLAGRAGRNDKRTPSRSLVGAALHTIGDLSPEEEKDLLAFLETLRLRRQETSAGAEDAR